MKKYSKRLLLWCFIIISISGFMIKLPVPLRGIDLELHAMYYFTASALLNLLFKVRDLKTHALIFGLLATSGVLVEFAQEYSNQLIGKRFMVILIK